MDYTIAENYTLPSLGKIYGVEVNPNIKIRSMTTQEEMKRLAPSEGVYKNICEIIDDCLVEKPGISSYDMHLGDYQFLLHKMRIVTYGPEYTISSTCPYCTCFHKNTINLDDLNVIKYEESVKNYFEFELPKTKRHIKLRMQTPRILDLVEERAKEAKRKQLKMPGDPAFLFAIEYMIDEIDGKKPHPLKITEFVQELPMMDTNYIIKHSQKINESIGLDTLLHNTCDVCGLEYQNRFRTDSKFFGPDIDI
jgi:hypothetical protein